MRRSITKEIATLLKRDFGYPRIAGSATVKRVTGVKRHEQWMFGERGHHFFIDIHDGPSIEVLVMEVGE